MKNYKNKERAVAEFIMNLEESKDLLWIHDKTIVDGCSKRRPDMFLDLGSHVIIIEIDEYQHTDYDTTCEQVREMELWQDAQCRPIVFIRFNPDKYVKDGNTISSCWKINKRGMCIINEGKKKEWNARLRKLKECLLHWISTIPEDTITTNYLFYDE